MQIRELIKIIENRFPPKLQESWDNSGLQIGNINKELKNILICLDITKEAIDFAISNSCNLIISHHPILFLPLKRIDTSARGEKIIEIIKHDICVYSAHTSSDVNGFNTYIFEKIGLISEGKIDERFETLGYGDYASGEFYLNQIVKSIKENLGVENITVYGDNNKFRKIGLITGSGSDMIGLALEKNLDALITGDITHHYGVDSVADGLTLIDAGHEGTERLFTEFMNEFLADHVDSRENDIFLYENDERYNPRIL